MSQTKHLIFDFDGVLGDTWDATVKAVMKVNGMTFEEAVKDLTDYFNKPQHSRKNNVSEEELAEWLAWTKKFGQAMSKIEFNLFDGFVKEVAKIKNSKMAIVSSGSILYIKDKVKRADLDFTHILTFESGPSKEEKVERICGDWGVKIKDACYFTDTKTDVIELEELMPEKIFGCSWGYSGYYGLLEVLPEERILQEFTDIHPVLEEL